MLERAATSRSWIMMEKTVDQVTVGVEDEVGYE